MNGDRLRRCSLGMSYSYSPPFWVSRILQDSYRVHFYRVHQHSILEYLISIVDMSYGCDKISIGSCQCIRCVSALPVELSIMTVCTRLAGISAAGVVQNT